MILLSLIFGLVVGLSLGLTGGGGAIFAVPLLVYGLGVPAREAVGISLAAVGATSLVGFLQRWRAGQVEIGTGLLFAVAGMVGAPLGSWIAGRLPETMLLLLFAGLMVIVAIRMWQSSPAAASAEAILAAQDNSADGPTCRRDATGTLILTSPCALLLLTVGLLTGLLAGLFGVGGGFVIVPALILFSSMSIHRAVGTSLMVIALISVSGVTAHLAAGRDIPLDITGLFLLGGLAGLFAGQAISKRLSSTVLQRVFVVAILAVAGYIVLQNLLL
ncbi:MAG: sulfite exporter TauE/SafE family protein [Planctomycetaceae bacterium]|nr:MAG: sulfite exporter TauE/SafE family protein [Planctomycetaceae bacterium]